MISRRQFLSAAAIATLAPRDWTRVQAQGARYDLIIRGGRVIDPSARLDAVRDVAIARGRIAAGNAAHADVNTARDAISKNRDVIVGVKARLSRDVAGQNDYEVLRRAKEVASSFGLPVMIHMGQTISPLPRLFDLLKRGDIVTHMFAPPPNSIVDDTGHILTAVLAARRRGVWFDVGNGQTGHMRWDTVGTIMKTGFWPDTFSTDWSTNSRQTGVIDLPNCMSKLLGYGMTLN